MTETILDRRGYIGGSDIAAIVGVSNPSWGKTAVDVWIDKTTPPTEDTRNLKAKRRGSRLEPYIRDMIATEYGMEIVKRNERYADPEIQYFACEIDAETAEDNIEIKTVHPNAARDWGDDGTDEVPIYYVAQVQWGLGITRRPRCHVFALIGDDLRRYLIERDDETITAMRETAEVFWQRYVCGNLRPPMDHQDPRTLDTLKRLYPGTDGSTVEATHAVEAWRSVLEEARDKVAQYQAVADGAKAHLMDVMGQAAVMKFADGKAFRRKLIQSKPYTVEARSYMDFRLVNVKE